MNDDISSIRQREKFKALLRERGLSLRRMSLDLGLNESYFQQFVAYGRPTFIDGEVLQQAAAYLGVAESDLAAPALSLQDSFSPSAYDMSGYRGGRKTATEGDVVLLPCYDLSSLSGEDNWRAESNRIGELPFPSRLLRLITSSPSGQLALLQIHNDAMAPALQQGDWALIDCSHHLASEDGIYGILHESRLLIKRVTVDPIRKQVILSQDNPAYPATHEYSLIDIRTAGRIAWVGKRL